MSKSYNNKISINWPGFAAGKQLILGYAIASDRPSVGKTKRWISARSRASWSDAEHIDEINARCDL